jgi:hypothetical protein
MRWEYSIACQKPKFVVGSNLNIRGLLWQGCSQVSGLSGLHFEDPRMLAIIM